jgi:hypothetical protein
MVRVRPDQIKIRGRPGLCAQRSNAVSNNQRAKTFRRIDRKMDEVEPLT